MPEDRLPHCQYVIVSALRRRGGKAVSLSALTMAEMHYANAHRALRRLEAAGMVLVERRGPGSPLRMTLPGAL